MYFLLAALFPRPSFQVTPLPDYYIPPDDPCKDDESVRKKCVKWASKGECESNPKYMSLKCKFSCRTCTPKFYCKDNDNDAGNSSVSCNASECGIPGNGIPSTYAEACRFTCGHCPIYHSIHLSNEGIDLIRGTDDPSLDRRARPIFQKSLTYFPYNFDALMQLGRMGYGSADLAVRAEAFEFIGRSFDAKCLPKSADPDTMQGYMLANVAARHHRLCK